MLCVVVSRDIVLDVGPQDLFIDARLFCSDPRHISIS